MLTLLLIVLIITCSALVSALETAITASVLSKVNNKILVNSITKKNHITHILKNKHETISSLLIINNILNISATTLATSFFIDVWGKNMQTVLAMIILSIILILCAEIIPKILVVNRPENIFVKFIYPIRMLIVIFKPLNNVLNSTKIFIQKLFKIHLHSNTDIPLKEEIEGLMMYHLLEGHIQREDVDMVSSIFNIKNTKVSEIMTKKEDIFSVNKNTNIEKLIKILSSSHHSRIPVFQGKKDNIIGIIYLKDLVNKAYSSDNREQLVIDDLITKPLFINENNLVMEQLKYFKNGSSHFACITNDKQDLIGIITLEDILEEIVGQIYDEYDKDLRQIIQKSPKKFVVSGLLTVKDLNRELSLSLPEKNFSNTLSSFIINKMKYIPKEGEYFIYDNLKMNVLKKSHNVILTINLEILSKQES